MSMAAPPQNEDLNKDLGFGSRVSQQSRQRFLNRDGTFNVERKGLGFLRSHNIYHWFLTISWVKFFLLIAAAYFVINIVFAFGYMLCGTDALHGLEGYSVDRAFLEEFFFSVQTLATIGYGRLSPNNMAANVIVTFEALVGLLGFALATGLLFARFSRPNAKIIFSNNAIIAPYRDAKALMFRIANQRSNQLLDVQAIVTLGLLETVNGVTSRKFHQLSLEREKVVFFPLHWVIVHPIDETSPLHGFTKERFTEADAEIFILLTGTDETFSQSVHARSSYKHEEVRWGVKFTDMFLPTDDGIMSIDLRKIHDVEDE
jgi:inward rectifier potassium channel